MEEGAAPEKQTGRPDPSPEEEARARPTGYTSSYHLPVGKVLRLLLIEDHQFTAEVICRMLGESRDPVFMTEVVGGLSSGSEELAKGSYDVVLMDLSLPDCAGLQSFTSLYEGAVRTPIVVLTSADDEAQGTQAVQQGAEDYLIKGQVDARLLARSLRYAIERHWILSELGQYAQELQSMESGFRNIITRSPVGILILDQAGKILYANPEAKALLARPSGSLIGEPFEFSTQDRHLREIEIVREDGTTSIAEMVVTETEWDWQSALFVSLRDITERKRAVEALERSNADLSEFAYIVSHDLQEPLRMVTGYCGLLEKRYGDQLDSKAGEFMSFIHDGAKRMELLIRDLLAYSRVQTKASPFFQIDLERVCNDAVVNLEVSIRESGAEVTVGKLPELRADPTQLVQVFQNLIGNAIKFRGEEPPKVQVSAELEEGKWTIRVSDNGIGIAPQYIERIFRVFQRLHTQSEYPGTGIGLAICRKVVERHGGQLWVESEEGRGSTFCFSLPEGEA